MKPKSKKPRAERQSPHPDIARLIALVSGEVGGESRRLLSAHTAGCSVCLDRVRSLSIVLRAGSAEPLEPIPPGLRQDAVRLFDTWRGREMSEARAGRAPAPAWRSVWGRLRMRLAPPTLAWSQMAFPAGLRSVAAPARCELEGGGYRVEIEWTTSGRISTVRGRLIQESEEPDGRPALSLEFEDSAPRRVPIGPRGFFGPVPASAQRLRAVLTTARQSYRSRWLELA